CRTSAVQASGAPSAACLEDDYLLEKIFGFAFRKRSTERKMGEPQPLFRYRYPVTEKISAPIASTIRSHMVSRRPLFCILRPKRLSIPNSKISQIAPAPIDRKSTRLNSSHVKISYAVFCLKNNKN